MQFDLYIRTPLLNKKSWNNIKLITHILEENTDGHNVLDPMILKRKGIMTPSKFLIRSSSEQLIEETLNQNSFRQFPEEEQVDILWRLEDLKQTVLELHTDIVPFKVLPISNSQDSEF